MTKLTFFKDGDHYLGFACEGHSGYSDEGSDIVCAAVSAATQMVCAYLTEYFGENVSLCVDEQSTSVMLKCSHWFLEADRQMMVLLEFAKSIKDRYTDYFTYEFLGGVNND